MKLQKCFCAALIALATTCAVAVEYTWIGVGTNLDWWDPANWDGGTVGVGAGNSLDIEGSGDTSIYLTNSISLKNIGVTGAGTKVVGGTGAVALADGSGGNGYASMEVVSTTVHVDVPVSGVGMNIGKRGNGSLYLNGRISTTGYIRVEDGTLASDWSRVADTPSPTTGDSNVVQDILPVTDLQVFGNSSVVRFNPRVSRASDQSFAVALSSDSPFVTLTSTSNVSAGQQVEAAGGVLAAGTFIRRVVNGTTVELSAKPLATANATLNVKAAPISYSRQNLSSLSVYAPFTLGLNSGFQMYAQKLAGEGGDITMDRPGRLIVGDTRDFSGTVTFTNSANANLSCNDANPLSGSLPVTDSLLFRMDASDESTLTLDGDRVTAWRTVSGAGDVTATPAGSTSPVFLRNALNGKPVVDMGPAVDDGGMEWSSPVSGIKTFFVVVGSQVGGGTLLGAKGTLENYAFARGYDSVASKGIHANNQVYSYPLTRDHVIFKYNSDSPTFSGLSFWINGSRGCYLTPLSGDYDLVSGTFGGNAAAASAFARVNDGTTVRTGSEGGQRLAEVILYSRVLSEAERQSVEAYLQRKWFGKAPRGWDGGYIERVVDNSALETVAGPVTAWTANGANRGGRVRIGTLEQTSACTYYTIQNESHVIDQAKFAKKLRLMGGASVEFTARQTSSSCPVPGAALHVDATRNVETDAQGHVLFWGGVDGAGYACTNRNSLGAKPTLVSDGFNGKPVVDFGTANSTQHLVWHTNIMVRALFYVMKAENPKVSFCGSVCPEMNVVDHFTRYNNANGYIYDPTVQIGACGGIVRLDGHRILAPNSYYLSQSAFKLLGHTLDSAAMANAFGCGALQNGNLRSDRTGGLKLAEVIIYDRKLTDDESLAIQAYLRYKWFGETLAGFSAPGEPFVVPGLGAGDAGSSVTIRGTAPVTVGNMFGTPAITLSAPDGAVVTVPAIPASGASPLVLSNACVAASSEILRGVTINAGTTNSLVSAIGGRFTGGALVHGTLKVNGDAAVDMAGTGDYGYLRLYSGGTLLLAPASASCAGIVCNKIDAYGVGTVRLELPDSLLDNPTGRYTVVSAPNGYTTAASRANMEGWSVTSNLKPAKWNVSLKVTDSGVDVAVTPKGLAIIFR